MLKFQAIIMTTSKKKPSVDIQPPNWPVFKSLVPTSHLALSTLLDSQIVVIRNFWTSTLCKNYVSFLKGLPLTTTPGKPKKGDALRFNDRYQINDEVFANRLWLETGLRELICGSEEEEDNFTDNDVMSKEDRRILW
jgi:hypothetical protein